MKCVLSLCLVALAASSVARKENPIDKVVSLIEGLAKAIENDGKTEQASYDKYACWVESTMARKASDISSAKEEIDQLQDAIKKNKAALASHGAEIAQLNKDIAKNKEAAKEATTIRDKDNAAYAEERSESEQCIGALEAAIKVLTGAGSKKAGFMQQFHEAQLMSVAEGLRKVVHASHSKHLSSVDADTVMRFVGSPSEFMKQGMVAAQTGQNPFGDYAPQSSAIQGILKGQYDAFTTDLEKENADEAKSQKSFEALIATKDQERKTLVTTLQKQETDHAAKTKQLSEDSVQLDDTTEQLAADEKFFEATKQAAQDKANQWSTRTRLRVEELAGMEGAIKILQGGDATFEESANGPKKMLLELDSVSVLKHSVTHEEAFGKLKALAAKYKSSGLLKVVAAMRLGGHFDKVMVMIDEMMGLLRKEEQSDIEHRDRCENGQNANANQMEDLNSAIAKNGKELERMGRTDKNLEKDLTAVKGEISASKKDLASLLEARNKDHEEFVRALKMDSEAVSLIGQAMVRLTKFYKENKIAVGLVQAPEYAQDADKAPETTFSSKGSRQGESTGIVAILDMIKEDLQKEMKEGRADEASGQSDYEKQSGELQESLDAQEESKVSIETQRADLAEKKSSVEKSKTEKEGDLGAQGDMKKSLSTDCDWVKSNFKSRRDKRKTEMEGLVDAKSFLAGVESGDAVIAP